MRNPARRSLRIDVRTRPYDDPQAQFLTELEEWLERVDATERDLTAGGLDETPVRVDRDGVEACGAEFGEDVAPKGGDGQTPLVELA